MIELLCVNTAGVQEHRTTARSNCMEQANELLRNTDEYDQVVILQTVVAMDNVTNNVRFSATVIGIVRRQDDVILTCPARASFDPFQSLWHVEFHQPSVTTSDPRQS